MAAWAWEEEIGGEVDRKAEGHCRYDLGLDEASARKAGVVARGHGKQTTHARYVHLSMQCTHNTDFIN